MSNEFFWAVGRSTGVVAMVLLTLSVAMGVRARAAKPFLGLPRFAVTNIHRSISLMSVVFTMVHVLTLLFDKYSGLNLMDMVVPFGASINIFLNALGTVSLDLLLALAITGLLKTKISERFFHLVHWSAYLCWPLAIVHAFEGSDLGELWYLAVALTCIAVVCGSLIFRLSTNFSDYSAQRYREVRS